MPLRFLQILDSNLYEGYHVILEVFSRNPQGTPRLGYLPCGRVMKQLLPSKINRRFMTTAFERTIDSCKKTRTHQHHSFIRASHIWFDLPLVDTCAVLALPSVCLQIFGQLGTVLSPGFLDGLSTLIGYVQGFEDCFTDHKPQGHCQLALAPSPPPRP